MDGVRAWAGDEREPLHLTVLLLQAPLPSLCGVGLSLVATISEPSCSQERDGTGMSGLKELPETHLGWDGQSRLVARVRTPAASPHHPSLTKGPLEAWDMTDAGGCERRRCVPCATYWGFHSERDRRGPWPAGATLHGEADDR